MTQPLILASADRPPVRRASTRRPELPHGTKRASSDQDLARLTSVNTLAVGGKDEVAALIASLWPALATPVVVRHRNEPLRLTAVPPAGTFVIYDVETLTPEEQDALHRWLQTADGPARVVSSASAPVFPMVESGAFNDELYYRLNVVTIDLTSPVLSHPHD